MKRCCKRIHDFVVVLPLLLISVGYNGLTVEFNENHCTHARHTQTHTYTHIHTHTHTYTQRRTDVFGLVPPLALFPTTIDHPFSFCSDILTDGVFRCREPSGSMKWVGGWVDIAAFSFEVATYVGGVSCRISAGEEENL